MKNTLLRVSQTNAIYLDNEIYNCLRAIIQEATKTLPPGLIVPYEAELNLALNLALLWNSVWKNNCTFGQQLLAIKYEQMSKVQKCLYLFSQSFEYLKAKFEWSKPSAEINGIMTRISMILQICELINLSIFLRYGSKPLLIERVLGLEQVYATENAQRRFESKYMARELLWNGFIEVLVYILPLVNYHKMKRFMKKYNPLKKRVINSLTTYRTMTMHSRCAFCKENPILPHHMGCAHIFCYICLKSNQAADSKFECPICEHKNPNLLCDKVLVM